jgi:NitT/TauT family transport system permease protein
VLLAVLALMWELYARWLNNPLLFPSFSDTIKALFISIASGEIPRAAAYSIGMLLKGYAIGLLLAGLLTAFASAGRIGSDLLETLTAMFNPLPSLALLPLALIWFGLGSSSMIFVLILAVLWPVSLNMHGGFRAVSPTLKMVGQNYGLSKPGYVVSILLPAAVPNILTGLRVGGRSPGAPSSPLNWCSASALARAVSGGTSSNRRISY